MLAAWVVSGPAALLVWRGQALALPAWASVVAVDRKGRDSSAAPRRTEHVTSRWYAEPAERQRT